ncbi:lysophospholipid acyltransferase family protein [Thioclava sp. FR2]|uniref:lysophospholipid acyltransferase family protein n=1 Tax=Thioclava sp. FR2 TaxID=3445780 RepID=UPI003EBB16E2
MIIVRWILSILFIVQMYVAMLVIGILFFPWALLSKEGAFAACKAFCRWVLFTVRIMCGIRSEVRGTPPTGEVMIAAKHQSFLDILMIFNAVPRGKFIMKRELMYTPILGQYAMRIGCVMVDRGKRGAAITKMKADVAKGAADPGQLIIYPQGTRVAPGDVRPYKVGTGLLYEQLGQTCVPVAANVGLFWPKRSLLRTPGLAVVEFLTPIEQGLSVPDFMKRLEAEVETNSNRLMADAGFGGAKP